MSGDQKVEYITNKRLLSPGGIRKSQKQRREVLYNSAEYYVAHMSCHDSPIVNGNKTEEFHDIETKILKSSERLLELGTRVIK